MTAQVKGTLCNEVFVWDFVQSSGITAGRIVERGTSRNGLGVGASDPTLCSHLIQNSVSRNITYEHGISLQPRDVGSVLEGFNRLTFMELS